MTITQKIILYLENMPESAQVEVLDFVEYLESKHKEPKVIKDNKEWSIFSLAHAMRGMENEPTPYSPQDIKEVFSPGKQVSSECNKSCSRAQTQIPPPDIATHRVFRHTHTRYPHSKCD
jgi:hypothetical protein